MKHALSGTRRKRRALVPAVALAATALGLAACGSSGGAKPAGATAKQTIVFAESGLGTEGQATQTAISAFEKAHPDIKVKIDVLSSNSTTYLSQLEKSFTSGSPTPDVLESDVTYPAKLAQAGWVLNLNKLHPDMGQFFPAEVAAGTFGGAPYAVPWFDNPEGLYYRTDLIKTPPTSPAQVVSDAQQAMKQDPSLKEGLAFEGDKYEGAITAFLTVDSAFGGKLNPQDVDTPGNLAALTWLHDAIYQSRIAPAAVTGWQEGQVEQQYVSGHAAFAINYPFVESLATSAPVKGNTGYIPFPAGPGGTPGSALGGEMLAINAKTAHAAASWKLIQYLTSPAAQITRAEVTGDPPSRPSAYTSALYARAPYFRNVKVLNSFSQPRPVNPNYLTVSHDLQVMLSEVFANTKSPSAAMSSAAARIKRDAAASAG